ncbi:immunity protein YezG family protein [Metabacillus halosaccharovorans]|uniref:immunity protein YezG family protein n=1 Tax=Metabacillus halosaccharovorans TaxID=930124 RepID=UPI00203F455D|nr:immunity protein YezG family protein [Metabacillus halosaccharovorans]MCM3439382.1 antitoxin YezG family protein [Metabacillus halosaccharovorans]
MSVSFELELNRLYNEIAQQVNDMIPTDWDNIYFNGEVKEGEGGVFFFFTPKDDGKHIFSHYIPKLYSVDKRAYNKEVHKLFQLTVELQKVFADNDQEPWFSVTLLLNASGKLDVHFDYTNWFESEFGPTARIKYFEYKYLSQNNEQFDLDLIEKMKKFEEK